MEPGPLVRAMRAGDELRARATADVVLENLVGVIQVGNDQIEVGEIVRQLLGQFAATREKPGQRAGFDGLRLVGQAAGQGQGHDVRIAEHFQARLGKLPTQRGHGRQGQNEIPNGAASNDQDLAAEGFHKLR